jgi:hypothetical protein
MTKFWINTISLDHVLLGVDGGFTQANHGKAYNLKKFSTGDGIVFYSPKTSYDANGKPLQAFTAIGEVSDDDLYQHEMTPDFTPIDVI